MVLNQISVKLPDKPGELLKFTKLLNENGIEIRSITVSGTGVCLFIVNKTADCMKLLKSKKYDASTTEIVAAVLPNDKTGSEVIEKIAKTLGENSINIDFLYSTYVKKSNYLIIHVSDAKKARDVLKAAKVYIYEKDDF